MKSDKLINHLENNLLKTVCKRFRIKWNEHRCLCYAIISGSFYRVGNSCKECHEYPWRAISLAIFLLMVTLVSICRGLTTSLVTKVRLEVIRCLWGNSKIKWLNNIYRNTRCPVDIISYHKQTQHKATLHRFIVKIYMIFLNISLCIYVYIISHFFF